MAGRKTRNQKGHRLDVGRLVARILCAVFGLVGVLPLAGGLLARTRPVLGWAAAETARVLEGELGVVARYRVELQLWPLQICLHDLEIPATDGPVPALTARRISVRPRVFSLLAGRLDVGEIEVDTPRGRLVVRQGRITNLSYRIPEPPARRGDLARAPFSSLSVTDAVIDLDLDGLRISAGPLDLDVFSDWGPSFEIGVRSADVAIVRERQVPEEAGGSAPGSRTTIVDEDVICALDLRARVEPESLLVRRLSLVGLADPDPRPNSRPSCTSSESADEHHPDRVALRLSQVRYDHAAGVPPTWAGHLVLRAPAGLTNRFVRAPKLDGWVGVVADFSHNGRTPLPEVHGKLRGGGLRLERYQLAKTMTAEFDLTASEVRVPRLEVELADGKTTVRDLRIQPFAPRIPLQAREVLCAGIKFPGLMRDVAVTDQTIVNWDIEKAHVTNLSGTLFPLAIDGKLLAETRDFGVYDRSVHQTARRLMIGVPAAQVRGRIGIRANAIEFYDTVSTFGRSALHAPLVSIGFSNRIRVDVEESTLDLADLSAIAGIPWSGQATLTASMAGDMTDPPLTGKLRIADFVFGGFPVGSIATEDVRFRPLHVELRDVRGKKGRSNYLLSSARLDFDQGATVIADARATSDHLDVRDFFAMFHFDEDPRFAEINGSGALQADIHYALGGAEDTCGGGFLRVAGAVDLHQAEAFGERYDDGQATFDYRWFDRDAGYLGFELDIPSVTLKKGSGTLLGSISMTSLARITGHVVATGIPASELHNFGALGQLITTRASGVAEISGSVDALRMDASVQLSPSRLGGATLPASELFVTLEPALRAPKHAGTTRCGNPIPTPFDRAEHERDETLGTFRVTGSLFGNQIKLHEVKVSRQRAKHLSGDVELQAFDLGTLSELVPTAVASRSRPRGKLSARLQVEDLSLEDPYAARAAITLTQLSLHQDGAGLELMPGARTILLADHGLEVPGLALKVAAGGGFEGVIDARARIDGLGRGATVDGAVRLRPLDLSRLATLVPRVERASGQLEAEFQVTGPVRAVDYRGGLHVRKGELVVRGLPAPITGLELALGFEGNELRLRNGKARMGSGTLELSGSAPVRDWQLGTARVNIAARNLTFEPSEGVKTTVNADLVATWEPNDGDGESVTLPRLTGDVQLSAFEYTRPITMSADISTLAQRGRRTAFERYDPADDKLHFDFTVRSAQPLKIDNNLVSAQLELAPEGLQLTGTNQRFGLRGTVRVRPGGRLQLRRNEFEIQQGQVRFDDLTRVAPQVDVTAVTDYRRYADAVSEGSGGTDPASSPGTTASGGQWHIVMHAYGDADQLRIDLTSQPALAQDDIFLLLTVGLTRAELDQARSASVGESVALEALGTLSGADRAVTDALPVIDDFRFGSAYSPRTGRTEPTVTIGKRLADRIRANVTSGLTDSREVRSNIEWKLSRRVSVEGSYDNVNDISSSSLGNLGADIRWRLEFR